jgi:hypothetical protein
MRWVWDWMVFYSRDAPQVDMNQRSRGREVNAFIDFDLRRQRFGRDGKKILREGGKIIWWRGMMILDFEF